MKKLTAWLLLLVFALSACLPLASCENKTPAGGTEAPTAAQNDPGTSAPTEAPTDAPTETPTETPTEAETEEPWLRTPVSPDILTFGEGVDTLISRSSGFDYEVVRDEETGSALKLSASAKRKGNITFDYETYVKSLGMTPVSADDYKYVVVRFRTDRDNENGFGSTQMSLYFTAGGAAKMTEANSKTAAYTAGKDGWQGAMYDFSQSADWKGSVHAVRLDPMDRPGAVGETMYIESIRFFIDREEAYAAVGIDMIRPGSNSDLKEPVLSDVSCDAQTAPDEDKSVSLWFDHISEKVAQNNTTSTGRNTYVMYMPGNAIEDCQFFLAPAKDRSFDIELTPFADKSGHTLKTALYWERYYNVNGTMIPDALPPLSGSIAVKGGQSQGFVIKVWADTGAAAGLYTAQLTVKDAKTGKIIKAASVYTVVWDFSLGDDTRMATAFGMGQSHIYNSYTKAGMKDMSSQQLYKMYYDYLLENRISCYILPYNLTEPEIADYLANPRVTSYGVNWIHVGSEEYANAMLSFTPDWMKKGYFYLVDEPTNTTLLNQIKQHGERLSVTYPTYRMLSPFFTNIDVGNVDEIEFLRDYLGIWCTKVNAFTPREYSVVPGTRFMTTAAQDEKYGTFAERMAKEVANGDDLWVYYCWEPEQPYCNWMLTDDGTECIVSVWQCRNTKCTGLLYWGTTYWTTDLKSAPAGTPVWGDGVLIHSGAEYGIYEPVSSLRLENLRCGIQDYQMLSMIEEKSGAEAADEMAARVSKNVVCYTNDDTYLHACRILLGETVEALYK